MRIFLFLLLVLSSISAHAETITISQTTSFKVAVPGTFKISHEESPFEGESPSTIISNGETKVMFSPMTIPNQGLSQLGGLQNLHLALYKDMLNNSVEKKLIVEKLNDFGFYSVLTDSRLVGKQKENGHFLLATVGVIQGDNGVLPFVALHDSLSSQAYQSIMNMLHSGTIAKGNL